MTPSEERLAAFQQRHGVDLIRKDDDPVSRAVAVIWPRHMVEWWTTIRYPWNRRPRILYPTTIEDPLAPEHAMRVAHELEHVPQTLGWRLYWSLALYVALPLPFFLSGRWLLERKPHLVELRAGIPIDAIVERLWHAYLWPWPRRCMRRWFEKQAEP